MDVVHVATLASLALAPLLVGCAYGPIEATESTSSSLTTGDRRHLRGRVTGLLGGGLVLADAAAGTVSASGEGTVVFPNALTKGDAYALAIDVQPTGPRQTCGVTAGSGVVGDDDPVVEITCASPTFTVGGHVSGVDAVGLVLELAPEGKADEVVAVGRDGTFRFTSTIAAGASYVVAVAQPPTGETCQAFLANGIIAAADVDDVEIVCSIAKRPITGSVRGLDGNVILANGEDVLSVNGSGRFTMPEPVTVGASYALTAASAPAGETCTITGGAGTMTDVPVEIVVDCAVDTEVRIAAP